MPFTDQFVTIVCIIMFIVFISVYITAVTATTKSAKDIEAERKLTDAAEAIMSFDYVYVDNAGDKHQLTVARNVFNLEAIEAIKNDYASDIEPVRYCDYGMQFIFATTENIRSGNTAWTFNPSTEGYNYPYGYAKLGYGDDYGSSPMTPKASYTFPTGFVEKPGSKKTYTGFVTINLYSTDLTRIACAVEKAWKYREVQRVDVELVNNIKRGSSGGEIIEKNSGNQQNTIESKAIEPRAAMAFSDFSSSKKVFQVFIIPTTGTTNCDAFDLQGNDGLVEESSIKNSYRVARNQDPNRIIICASQTE
jgi:hypothetical protein